MRNPSLRLGLLLVWLTACAGFLARDAGGQAPVKPKVPSLVPVLGKNADSTWLHVSGGYTLTADGQLGKQVLTVDKTALILDTKAAATGGRSIKALVRLKTTAAVPSATASFSVARKDAKDPGLVMSLTTSRGTDSISAQVFQAGKPLHDAAALAKKLDWDPTPGNGFTYSLHAYALRDIRPGWPEDFRARIEHDMAALTDADHKWLSVRIEVAAGAVRFWLDDHLVGIKKDPSIGAAGLSRIELSPGVQLASYDSAPLASTRGYVPIRLEGYTNGRALVAGAG